MLVHESQWNLRVVLHDLDLYIYRLEKDAIFQQQGIKKLDLVAGDCAQNKQHRYSRVLAERRKPVGYFLFLGQQNIKSLLL